MSVLKKATELADEVLELANWCAKKLESQGSVYHSQEALGSMAEVSVKIESGRTGEIVVEIGQSRRHYPARAKNETDTFVRGAKVRIVDIAGNVMYVESFESDQKVGEIVSL